MAKTLSGGALIGYGSDLPEAGSTLDGSLFYKTDNSGGAQGLYLYGFLKDTNTSLFGSQVAQDWIQVVSPDLFVSKLGDTMLGALTVPGTVRITQTSGPQRLLIGNQDNAGANKPVILESSNGALSIGTGTNWAQGGTLTTGLSLNISGGATGLTWLGNQVWHAGRMGAGSLLDSDRLDGQEGSFYLNLNNGAFTGTLPVSRGGTGMATVTAGGLLFGTSSSAIGTTSAGTANQVLISNGTAAPSWVNQSTLSVGSATTAVNATNAVSAQSAQTAVTASSVAWSGITGFGSNPLQTINSSPSAGVTTFVRPSLFYDLGSSGGSSLTPDRFPSSSITGFDSLYTSDIGANHVGLTIIGNSSNGSRGMQLAANWDFEESAPVGGLKYRVNDTTGNTGAWGAFQTLWDQGNLTKLSQLTNDSGFVTLGSVSPLFVSKTGDTMTGALTTPSLVLTTNDTQPRIEFTRTTTSVRQANISVSSLSASADGGTLRYTAGGHNFRGSVSLNNDLSFSDGSKLASAKCVRNQYLNINVDSYSLSNTTQVGAFIEVVNTSATKSIYVSPAWAFGATATFTIWNNATNSLRLYTTDGNPFTGPGTGSESGTAQITIPAFTMVEIVSNGAAWVVTDISTGQLIFTNGVVPNGGDVFPPAGCTMSNLVAFVPSINAIFFNGDVDNNDSLYCYHTVQSDRVRITVYNSEQRATGYANYLAVWRK